MITALSFENFRGFTGLSISPLRRINLIAGANNTGKTGILEGLYLLFADGLEKVKPLPSLFRCNIHAFPSQTIEDDYPTFWQSLFYDRQTDVESAITATEENGERFACKLRGSTNGIRATHMRVDANGRFKPSMRVVAGVRAVHNQPQQSFTIGPNSNSSADHSKNPFSVKSIVISTRLENPTRDADLYNQVTLLEGGEERLLELLRQVDDRLQKLRYAKAPGTTQPLIYAHFGLKNALSMNQTGQGFSKLFSLFCQMLVSKAKVLFVDEIENGLYYEAMPQIWRGIAALAASENIQVFATTHSRECIVAAHETLKTMPSYDFALHRIQRVKGRSEAITHDQEMLETAIKAGMEVR